MSERNRLNGSFFSLKFSSQGLIKRFFSTTKLVSSSLKQSQIVQFFCYVSMLVSNIITIITNFTPRNPLEELGLDQFSSNRVPRIQSIQSKKKLSPNILLINI
jgi:hypothetical protein